jgi:regulator of replication initiation timing
MTAYEMPTATGSTSSKASSGLGGQVLVKSTRPKTVQQVYDNTRLFFSSLVLLSQNVTMPTTGGEADGKNWVTLLPVFVYMEAFLTAVMYPGMSVDLLILIREDTFRLIRQIINEPLCPRTLDSVLLEVSGRFEEILLGYALKLSFPDSGAKTSAKDTIDVFAESGNETSNDGSSFPIHGDAELSSLRQQITTLEERVTARNKQINVLREEKSNLKKENEAVLKENEELRRRVNSGGSASKRGQDESRARSNSRGRSGSNSRHGGGSKKHAHKKKVNYDSDR